MTTKNFGAGVSGYLDVDGRNFETTVYQASKPVLDSELNQLQDIDQARARSILQLAQSGWLGRDVLETSSHAAGIFIASGVANQLRMPAMRSLVNGWHISVENTTVATDNAVDLGAGPASGLRTDLIILEVWRRLLSASPSTIGKSQTARIWRNGNVKVGSGDDLSLNYADDILDAEVGSETTKRVQIQYRLRVVQGVNLDTYPSGIADPVVLAQSVPSSAATPDGTVTAFNYSNQSASGDGGLWRAGDGNPANGIGSVDGYIYALPLLAVFRRNTAAFARDTNHNGGSARPDSLTATIINARDVMDLRTSISTTGWDLQELLTKNVNIILDNTLRTEQGTTSLGGGSKGHTNIWADEIGPTDNPGAQRIRNRFDGVCRRFSDRPILEAVTVRFVPTDQQGGGTLWATNSVLIIDPTGVATAFRIYPHASANYIAAAPSNIVILDVLSMFSANGPLGPYDDSAGTGAFRPIGAFDYAQFKHILGLGTSGPLELQLGPDAPLVPFGDLYITFLVSYPGGAETTAGGLTKTPTADFGAGSFVLETPLQLPATAPYFFQALETSIDPPHREAKITYKTLTVSFTGVWIEPNPFTMPLSLTNTNPVFVPDRIASTPTPVITNTTTGDTYTGVLNISNDGHVLFLSNQAADWSLGNVPTGADSIKVDYQTVRPIPNNNVQFTIYYETRTPQTIRTALLGTTLTVIPRYVAPYMFTLVTGSGSLDEAYPFPLQYVQSPGVYPSSAGTFAGDHELDGTGVVSIADFNALTGFLQVPTLIPAVPEPQSLTFIRVGGDVDAEGRSFFKEVPAGYIPSAFAQPLSDSKRHKNVLPMIAELPADGPIGPKGTLLVVLLSRWSEFDASNLVGFDADLAANFTSASVYRLKGGPLNSRRA